LNVKGTINLDTSTYFDTIVIRRSDETSTIIHLNELQVWVNGSNILVENSAILTGYFALWADKIPNTSSVDFMYNNIIETNFGGSGGTNNALIIKNIPPTFINDIQAIIFYNRQGGGATERGRAIGLLLELYNSTNDPDLTEVLANTNVISQGVLVYRYDFPSIDTYTDFVGVNSITNIVNNSVALAEVANVISFPAEITGDVVISGSITSNGVNINTTLADILSRLELLENP